jgi:hypothetical protein
VDNIVQQEAGAWQVSFDSANLDPSGGLTACLSRYEVVTGPLSFIAAMKSNHPLACEYYARLVRISIQWAGPLISLDGKPPAILAWLSRASMAEFLSFLL